MGPYGRATLARYSVIIALCSSPEDFSASSASVGIAQTVLADADRSAHGREQKGP
jgi:hypothetical protein